MCEMAWLNFLNLFDSDLWEIVPLNSEGDSVL